MIRNMKNGWASLMGIRNIPEADNYGQTESEDDIVERTINEELRFEAVEKQRAYLVKRGKDIRMGWSDWTPSTSTDIKKTMREYVEKEIPNMKEAYSFLFVNA